MLYRFGKDIDSNYETGELLFIARSFPFDGTLPIAFIPKILLINPVPAGDILQVDGVGLQNTITAPFKFSALYGGALDDDNNQSVPILGPTFDGEMTVAGGGPLNVEVLAEQAGTGTWRTATTAPYLGTGDLDIALTTITDASPFIAPLPKVHDLVRILTGANGATAYRRITAVGANTITVDSAFATFDTGFSYTIAVSSTAVSGVATLVGPVLTDLLANFPVTTKVGWTVVLTAGADIAERRQVVSIDSATQLTLSAAFPTSVGDAYRIDNPLATYGGSTSAQAMVSSAVADELATIGTDQQAALFAFFTAVFNTIVGSSNGAVLVGNLAQLVDASVDFIASEVNTSHFVYIQSGPNAGIYQIASIDSPTTLTINTPFPSVAAGMTYSIVSAFSVTYKTLADLFSIITANEGFVTSTQAFQGLVNTPVPVLLVGAPDAGAFARDITIAGLNARVAIVQARLTYLTSPSAGSVVKVQNALASTERLYDKRYAWIDARINLEKGYLVSQTRAVANRIKTQQDVLNQLIKLLTVEGS
jgi:hypothetical protein